MHTPEQNQGTCRQWITPLARAALVAVCMHHARPGQSRAGTRRAFEMKPNLGVD